MIEGWIIFRIATHAFGLRKFYGWGRTRVLSTAIVLTQTLEQARAFLPRSRGLQRVRNAEYNIVELWLPYATVAYAQWRKATRRERASSSDSR